MQLASTPRASSLRMKTRARAGRVFRACPAGRPCVCSSGHPGQEPVLGPARWPLEGRGRAWFTLRPSLGPGAQELSASVRHGSDSGPRTHIRWEAPGCQKLAQDCHEEKPHGSFLLVFSRHFLICMFTEPRPCSETCASSLPAGVGSAARGRPSPAVGLAGAGVSISPGPSVSISPGRLSVVACEAGTVVSVQAAFRSGLSGFMPGGASHSWQMQRIRRRDSLG